MEPKSSDGFTLGACFSELPRKTLIASALGFAIVFKGVETQDGKSLFLSSTVDTVAVFIICTFLLQQQ